MDLSSRLAAIAGYIPPGSRVADIGTDHALLPVSLVKSGRSPWVVATDINEKPYLNACRHIVESGVSEFVEARKGNGLEPLRPCEIDVIVIAGMGGNTISGILAESRGVLAGVRRMVLQPMSDPGDLRLWLSQNGWSIVDETLVKEDGRYYVITVAEPGVEQCRDSFLLELGPKLLDRCSPLLIEYLEKIKSDYQRVLKGLAMSRSEEAMDKAIALTSKLSRITEVIDRCRQGAG
ncbi:MAG: tRNA (adenine(22)-N(1))-methyltransferase [Bacillota bacterium]